MIKFFQIQPTSEIPVIESFIEQRRAPRFETRLATTLQTCDGLKMQAIVCNVSSSGLQLLIPMALTPSLIPNQGRIPGSPSQLLHVDFEVNIPNLGEVSVHLRCSVIYVRRQPEDQCLVGCQFHDFSNHSDRHLEAFLQQLSKA